VLIKVVRIAAPRIRDAFSAEAAKPGPMSWNQLAVAGMMALAGLGGGMTDGAVPPVPMSKAEQVLQSQALEAQPLPAPVQDVLDGRAQDVTQPAQEGPGTLGVLEDTPPQNNAADGVLPTLGGLLGLGLLGGTRRKLWIPGLRWLALATVAGAILLGCGGRIPAGVQSDSTQLSTLLVTYYQGDTAFDDARRAARINTIARHEHVNRDGWITKPFQHGIVVVTCRLAAYLTEDTTLADPVRQGLLVKGEQLRVAVGKDKACPDVGR
jgi:hypothetical protein